MVIRLGIAVQWHIWDIPDRGQTLVCNPLVFPALPLLPVNVRDTQGQSRSLSMLWRGPAAWVLLPTQMVDFVLRFSSQP